jgi:hypothetical protein
MTTKTEQSFRKIGVLLLLLFGAATMRAQTTINFVVNQPPPPEADFGTQIQSDRITFIFNDSSSTGIVARKWYFEDGDSAVGNLTTVLHQYPTMDVYNACLTVTTSNGCTDIQCREVSSFVGVEENRLNGFGLSVSPNPFKGQAIIQYNLPRSSDVLLELYSITGARIRTLVNSTESAGQKQVQLLPEGDRDKKGIYFLKLTVDGAAYVKKIVELH